MFRNVLPENIFELFVPIFKIWKYIGLPLFTLQIDATTKNQKFLVEKTLTFYFVVIAITINSVFYNIIYKGIKKFEDYTNSSKLFISYVNHLGMLFFCRKHAHDYANNVSKCALLEKFLFEATKQKMNTKKIAKILLVMLGPRLLIMIFDVIKDLYYYNFDLMLFAYNGEWFYGLFVETLLLHFLLILQQLYKELENHLNVPHKNSDLVQSLKIYYLLQETAKNINKSFQKFILLKGFADFIFLTVNIFYSLTPQYTPYKENIFSYLFYLFYKWISIPLILIFNYIIARFYEDLLQIVRENKFVFFLVFIAFL